MEEVLWQWFFFFPVTRKQKASVCWYYATWVRWSYCKSEWLDQWKFYWFSRFVCCALIRIEKLSQPPQKPSFLFALALIHTVCIQPNNKWLPQPDQINFNNNMVDSSFVFLKKPATSFLFCFFFFFPFKIVISYLEATIIHFFGDDQLSGCSHRAFTTSWGDPFTLCTIHLSGR